MKRRIPIMLVILALVLCIGTPSIARVKSIVITATED
jgi:hypothetical protein